MSDQPKTGLRTITREQWAAAQRSEALKRKVANKRALHAVHAAARRAERVSS